MPPQWMWHLDFELEAWFESVQDKREAKYSGSDSSADETVPLMSNDFAKERRG